MAALVGVQASVATSPSAAAAAPHSQARATDWSNTRKPSPSKAKVIAYARAQLGKPFIWGGTGPAGFDCSGLVRQAFAAAGFRLPRGSIAQSRAGMQISRGQLQPGDLVFSSGLEHVQLYIGGGRIIEAAHTGTLVRVAYLPSSGEVNAYVRIS